ncbi:hypothetical protein EDB87DRAFT_945215 [Lactarius vividus]|nr:hypothetical protein EDB87DRAFT_945215 [Lactarius vividus]
MNTPHLYPVLSTIGRRECISGCHIPALPAVSWLLRSTVCCYYTCCLLIQCAAPRPTPHCNRQCDSSTHAAQLPGQWVVRPPLRLQRQLLLQPDVTADLRRTKRMRHLDALPVQPDTEQADGGTRRQLASTLLMLLPIISTIVPYFTMTRAHPSV